LDVVPQVAVGLDVLLGLTGNGIPDHPEQFLSLTVEISNNL
jgi:hypothetical protein